MLSILGAALENRFDWNRWPERVIVGRKDRLGLQAIELPTAVAQIFDGAV